MSRLVLRGSLQLVGGVVLALLFLLAGGASRAAKTDVVELHNGDHLTGEIKQLARGRLRFKTDAADTIYIDWRDVAYVTSASRFEVELTDGRKLFGSLEAEPEAGKVAVVGATSTDPVDVWRIVLITPIKDRIVQRIDGAVDLGFSFTSATRIIQYSLSANSSYRSTKYDAKVRLDSIFNDQEGVGTTQRDDLTTTVSRHLRNRRVVTGAFQLQSNPDLGFDLRALISAGLGVRLIQKNSESLSVTGGLSTQREKLVNSSEIVKSQEIVMAVRYANFKYHKPKRDISVDFTAFPSLTETDRIRIELNAKVRWEIVNNLQVGFSLLESFDSNPPAGTEETLDVALILSVGYTW